MTHDQGLGDEPPPAWRDKAPDIRTPIDAGAPVSGHRAPRAGPVGPSQAPEQDWVAAQKVLIPVLLPAGTSGTRLDQIDPERLASEGMKSHASPLLDIGPCGLMVGYVLRADAFDIHVNADHLLAWGVPPQGVRAAAMANMALWSTTAPWTEESSGLRRLLSSASGGGCDAARVLLPEVRAHIASELGSDVRVLVGIPDRDLLVAGTLSDEDPEFAALFAEFVHSHADDADQPLDRRVLELVGGELRPFEG